jgi:toxin CcdB
VRTRVVVPLVPVAALGTLISDLNPVVRIAGRDHAFLAQALATLTRAELGTRVGSLAERRDDFTRALDILLTGF